MGLSGHTSVCEKLSVLVLKRWSLALTQEAEPHLPFLRISLAGLQPFLVQAALGQMVQLFCPGNTSLEPQGGWQKDGHVISSDRYV